MKKILAIVLAVVMLLPVFAVNSFAADKSASETKKTETATGSFVCTFGDNDYDSAVATMTGVAADHTWGSSFPNITEIIEKVSPLAKVTSVKVTVTASNTDPCAKGVAPKIELHWDTRAGTNAMTAEFTDGVAVVSGDLPKGTTAVVLNPYAFASEAGEITFDVSVDVTYLAPAEPTEKVLFEMGEKKIADPWGDGFIITDKIGAFVAACNTEGSTFEMVYSVTAENWCNFNINGNSNTYVDGSVSGDEKKTSLGASIPGKIDMTPGENKKITMSGAEFLAYFTSQEGKECAGLWSPNGNTNVGDIYHGFDDISNIASIQIQPGAGNIFTVNSIKVTVMAAAEEPVKKVANYRGCIYVNEQYHAYLVGKYFIPAEHEDDGFGFCKSCHAELPTDEDEGPKDEIFYTMETVGGQDVEGTALADGVVLVDNQEAQNNCRIATNWKGGVYDAAVKAINSNPDAFVKLVYTGTVDKFMFQSEKGSYETEIAVTESAKEDDKSVAYISCADIIAGCPIALSGDFGGWSNMILHYEGEATLYGFSVMIPAPAADDDAIEVVEPTESNTPDEEVDAPDDTEVVEQPEDNNPPTGVVLAVLPMIIAAFACVASKRK